MRKLLGTVFVALILLSIRPLVVSADMNDPNNIANAKTPQQLEQAKQKKEIHKKSMRIKQSRDFDMHKNITQMDTNKDGMISKEEFMTFHEAMFDGLKQTNGTVSIKELQEHIHQSTQQERMHKMKEFEDPMSLHFEGNRKLTWIQKFISHFDGLNYYQYERFLLGMKA